MVMRLFLLMSLLLASTVLSAEGLTARVDRNQLGLGEQVELTVTLSGVRGSRPDTSALLKDFRIDRQSQSSNVQIINGVVSQEVSWTFLLSPNRKGKLTIPVLKVDQFSTDPIEIAVTEMPVAQSTSDDVLMEVEVSPKSPYLQSQIIYIQRLYFSRALVDNASISRPKLAEGDADIQFWGSSDPRYVTHKNRPYQLIERYYIIYPRKAGVLVFEPSVFNGSLASSQRRNGFQTHRFTRGTRVSAYSEKVSLTIKEKPASYTAEHWLPATQLTLSMNLSQPADTLKTGEPLTITIGLMAEGLKAEVLPEITLDLPKGIKSYPEKPSFRTDKVTNGMVGLRQEKVVLIANEAGEYTIPEVKIPWWDVTEDKQKMVTLESIVLKVQGEVVAAVSTPHSAEGVSSGESIQENKTVGDDQKPTESDRVEQVVPAEEAPSLVTTVTSGALVFYAQNKQAVLIGLCALVGLIGLGWSVLRRQKARLLSSEYQQQQAIAEALGVLKGACKQNSPQATITALSSWAAQVGIYPATLSGIDGAGDGELRMAVRALAAANYSPNPESWEGDQLYKAAEQYVQARQGPQSDNSPLRPLHPVSS